MKKIFTLALLIATTFIKTEVINAQNANIGDSLALVDFYNSTGGTNWLIHSNWLTTEPVKNWYGIALNSNGEVIEINLYGDNLVGSMPSSIGDLDSLQMLQLQINNLTGSIPTSLGKLGALQTLYLNQNQLTGNIPDSLGGLADLQNLNLSSNLLEGSIPSSLGNLNNLQTLDLSNNPLNGGIPENFSKLANLTFLNLEDDSLSGAIPANIANITKCQYLLLDLNKFSDTIPKELGNLTNLLWLDLSYNQLSGAIPANFGNLTKVQYLDLELNQLTGNIPTALGNLSNVQTLYLNRNHLTGSIPTEMGNLKSLTFLWLNQNQLSGNIPSSLGNLTNVQGIELANNQLTGNVPSSLGNLTNLQWIDLSFNLLNGNIPAPLANLPTPVLYLNNNYFTFDGMEAVAMGSKNVYYPQYTIPLHFSSNKLSVYAGGTLTNNTYKWYKGDTLIATVSADSTYKPTTAGNYSVAVTNSIATELTLYSDTMAITNAELPITYLNFTAQPTHNGNLLQWQTATEINSDYFNVQRSTDGVRFTNIAQVNAAGNSSNIQSYQYTDALTGLNPVPPALFYRLEEADKDGDVTYSKIIKLDNSSTPQVTLSIFPNPVHEILNVQLQGITGAATISITDASGKTLQAREVNAVSGQTISINTQALAAGVYFIQVLHDKQGITQKFVKE